MMADMTFEEIMEAVQKLTPQQKAQLAESLAVGRLDMGPTREELIAELASLRTAGAFNEPKSLRNKYANPALADLTDEQLLADIRSAATEWEQELDDLTSHD